MARVVILGAGVSGHTAASFARRWLGPEHSVTVVSPKPTYNWIPSNIWVGIGLMPERKVVFDLAPIYAKAGIEFHQAAAVSIHPEGRAEDRSPFVTIESTEAATKGKTQDLRYDYLINATGPKLKFEATPGLGPHGGHSLSVCTESHATEAAKALDVCTERMRRGERQRFLIGTGHGSCTCQGAAFEYAVNLEFELRKRKVRDKAEIVWISNEYELGDFGMGGLHLKRGGYVTPSKIFTESLFAERGLEWITRAHVQEVQPGRAFYETLDGGQHQIDFDFAMLLPPFSGVPLKAFDRAGEDISDRLFAKNGFMKVDADYSGKPFEKWKASDWPRTYQSPAFDNVYAVGIAFAPPHAISQPRTSARGTSISPTPPRTGQPSAMIGKVVAGTIVDRIQGKSVAPRAASMAEMGAACVASAGANPFTGTAASMVVYPIVPDFERFPQTGRDTNLTYGEIGLAGHWIKILLHHMFLHKAKLRPGWQLVPE
ncbi:Pyridine nucleotide-disulfide oxidoreductase [Planctomycetes bacterium Poly30]|uniref:Pyridine nucleotide-disulfide oxidoreductase n=1 Tax=Saltatorellus ferox TaxID=2528018 RepID=A0A518ESM1_9BACT|nr:Pyridine nucleotide-disulfide oxidoreductase [Planctomycetes bacterium Poly30]